MVNALAPWGVDPRAEDLYRQMLRLPNATPEEFVEKHGWKRDDFDASLRALIRARLVRTDGDGQHRVVPPIAVLDDLVIAEESRLASRSKQLEEARKALRGYASEFRSEVPAELPAAELVSFGQWDEHMLHNLIAAADGPLRIVYSQFITEPAARLAQLERAIALGYPMQVLVPAVTLNNERVMRGLQDLDSINAQIRLGTDAKSSFTIFGSMAASTLTIPDDYRCDRLVIRIPAIINILTSYFDSVWQGSMPVNPQEVDDDTRIIALLGEGLKDETIARNLGLSLRTVRRRIAEFMDEIGAETRFQAGAEAQRRGMV